MLTSRSFFITALFVAIVAPSIGAATTPTFTAGAPPSIPQIPPIPAPPCPPTPMYSWCDSIEAQVKTINGVIKIENQIAGQKEILLQEVAFPEKLIGHAQSDLNAFDNLVNQTDSTINDVVPNIDAAVQGSFSGVSKLVNPVAIDKVMAAHTKSAIDTMLLATHAADSANKRQLSGFSGLKTAAAKASTPQEALNLELQGLSILGSELAHSQTVQRARVAAEAQYQLDKMAKKQAADRAQEEAQARLARAFGEPAPTPTP